MRCDNCSKEDQWLECIGSQFICHKCIQKENKLMGNILRTHMDSFTRIMKKLNIQDFEGFKKIKREDVKEIIDISKTLNLKY